MVAVEMMKASGALALLCNLLAQPMAWFGLPSEVAPMVVVRPFSGMAALGMLDDIYRTTGPDSHAARTASAPEPAARASSASSRESERGSMNRYLGDPPDEQRLAGRGLVSGLGQ